MRKLLLILVLELLVYACPLRADTINGIPNPKLLFTFTASDPLNGGMTENLSFQGPEIFAVAAGSNDPNSYDWAFRSTPVGATYPHDVYINATLDGMKVNYRAGHEMRPSSQRVGGVAPYYFLRFTSENGPFAYFRGGGYGSILEEFSPGVYHSDSPAYPMIPSGSAQDYAGGQGTLEETCPSCLQTLTISDPKPVSTPEPGTLGMMAFGLGVLALVSWRRLRLTTELCREPSWQYPATSMRNAAYCICLKANGQVGRMEK